MKFIIGYKQEMTQEYRLDGSVVAVTVVKVEPNIVTQVKTMDKEGYNAVQIGIGNKKRIGKSQSGHLRKILQNISQPFHKLHEIRIEDANQFKIGDCITVDCFKEGDKVQATGRSKGKGFQGVVKRHGFHGAPASHGHKDQLRMPGSIGSQDPQHVFKGTKMGGRTGGDQITVKNLEIIKADVEKNLLYVKGALPGTRNSLVIIKGNGTVEVVKNIFDTPIIEEQINVEENVKQSSDKSQQDEKESLSKEETVKDNSDVVKLKQVRENSDNEQQNNVTTESDKKE